MGVIVILFILSTVYLFAGCGDLTVKVSDLKAPILSV